MRKSPKFCPGVVEHAVRMVFEVKEQYKSQWAAIESIAAKIGCSAETLGQVDKRERDVGQRAREGAIAFQLLPHVLAGSRLHEACRVSSRFALLNLEDRMTR